MGNETSSPYDDHDDEVSSGGASCTPLVDPGSPIAAVDRRVNASRATLDDQGARRDGK